MADDEQQALIDRHRPRVEQLLAEMLEQQRSTEADRAPVALDQQSVGRLSRMDAMQGQAMAAAAERRRAASIARLRATLARMDEGEFGYCAECGDRIAEGRLSADPSHHLCVACAGRAG